MRLRNLVEDDSAVSPVIGVILMVAITVILAAVIASFVLGLGGQTNVSPTADFSFNYDPGGGGGAAGAVTVTHTGGDNVREDELFIRGTDLDETGQWNDRTNGASTAVSGTVSGNLQSVSAVSSGDSAQVDVSDSGYVLRVVWEDTAGDTSSELAVNRGPDA